MWFPGDHILYQAVVFKLCSPKPWDSMIDLQWFCKRIFFAVWNW